MRHFSTLLIAVIVFPFNYLMAQDCAVAVDALKGKYEGECKNGKAEGMGKATGTDSYEGEFKSGMPNGKGKYTWSNGNWYDGQWYKGNKDGHGMMSYKLADRDSIIEGFWKKDAYAGIYEKPYIVHSRTRNVSSVSVKKMDDHLNRIEFNLTTETGNMPVSVSSTPRPKQQITDISVLNGRFDRRTETPDFGKSVNYIFEDVTFPFRAIFTMGNEQVEIEFLEAGRWSVDVRLHY